MTTNPDALLPPPRLTAAAALFLDFDGTLAPFAPRPQDVVIAPYLQELLWRIRLRLSGAMAVVSGRPIRDLDRFLKGAVLAAAGIHGLERRRADGRMESLGADAGAMLDGLRVAASDLADRRRGVLVEDKGVSVALHCRRAPDAMQDCLFLAARAVTADASRLESVAGEFVVEVRLKGADKAAAVRAFLGEVPFAARTPVFVGDDLTDETAFLEVRRLGGTAVIVGPRRPTVAQYALSSVHDVHDWLGALR